MLTVNLTGIQALYNKLASVKTLKARKMLVSAVPSALSKVLTIDQVLHGLNGVTSNLSEDKLVRAFYLSKMTVPDEITPAGQAAYTFLKWPEYVEFICRLAFIKEFKNDRFGEVKLVKKLQPVLECLLALVGQKVTQPTTLAEEVSESDDDY